MKKTLRSTFSVLALAVFAVAQTPKAGDCQMLYGSVFAAGCQMSCCHTKLPMPNCPLLKAQAPQDFISASAPILEVGLTPLHFVQMSSLQPRSIWSAIVTGLSETIAFVLIGPPVPARAPPSDVHLLAA